MQKQSRTSDNCIEIPALLLCGMNPYRRVYTEDEKRRIESGQGSLLERWNQAPFSEGQPRGFAVRLGTTVMGASDEVAQVFVARHAAPALTLAWERDLRRLGLGQPEWGEHEFRVRVPHRLHLHNRWLPCSWDAQCLSACAVQAALAVFLLGFAAFIAHE